MHKVLVSRCLLGDPVRYDAGSSGPFTVLARWQAEGRIVPLCPEVAGGLPTPRPPAEIPGGQGVEVWLGRERVIARTGEDVTEPFMAGARLAVELVRKHGIRVAVLKANSPSCGNELTYDGTFSGVKVVGQGVTAAALREVGVLVFNEMQLDLAAEALSRL